MRTMHLFAGAGGGLLADLILGHTPVVAVEWEPYPCQVLRERRDDGWFPNLRVWEGDVRLFDPSEYAGVVDCIHAGFPCQDISQAGKQAGVGEGTRSGLYREVLRIAGTVRPRFIFLENVAAIKSNGLEQVVKDLALMGYDTRWLCIRASDVGAPHHRDRWFALAYTKLPSGSNALGEQCFRAKQYESRKCCALLPDTIGKGLEGEGLQELTVECCQNNVPNTECQRLQGQGQSISAEYSATTGNGETIKSINGGTSDFWSTEPSVGRVVNGMAHRTHRLKALGNGQVPLQVAVAFTILAEGLIDAYS